MHMAETAWITWLKPHGSRGHSHHKYLALPTWMMEGSTWPGMTLPT